MGTSVAQHQGPHGRLLLPCWRVGMAAMPSWVASPPSSGAQTLERRPFLSHLLPRSSTYAPHPGDREEGGREGERRKEKRKGESGGGEGARGRCGPRRPSAVAAAAVVAVEMESSGEDCDVVAPASPALRPITVPCCAQEVGRLKVLPLARRTQLNRRSFRVLLPCARRVEVLSCALYTR
jgi:hypothetical protein